jgi:hypothetical protein
MIFFWTAIWAPYNMAFTNKSNKNPYLVLLGKMVTYIVISDIIMTFFTAYKDKNGKVVDKLHLIGRKYIKSWLFTDLLVIFPLELVLDKGNIVKKGTFVYGEI